jgi:hypothetical protein
MKGEYAIILGGCDDRIPTYGSEIGYRIIPDYYVFLLLHRPCVGVGSGTGDFFTDRARPLPGLQPLAHDYTFYELSPAAMRGAILN